MRIDQLNEGLENRKVGNFGFSAVKLEELRDGASEYTLVTIVVDCSGSTSGFSKEMESAVKEIVRACSSSERADNLMIRLIRFDTKVDEVHGYKLLPQCNESDYDGVLTPGGMTALYDAVVDALEASYNFADELDSKEDILSNGIVFVLTDGDDNSSALTMKRCQQALQKAVLSEKLESLVSVLISINHEGQTEFAIISDDKDRHAINDFSADSIDSQIYQDYNAALQECRQNHSGCKVVPVFNSANDLSQFDRTAGFTTFIPLKDASRATLAKLAEFVSKSISSQSQSLGSGAPSTSLTF